MTLDEIKALGTSAVCDAINALGLGVRSLDNYISPLNEKNDFCYGPAFTIKGGRNGTNEDIISGGICFIILFQQPVFKLHRYGRLHLPTCGNN